MAERKPSWLRVGIPHGARWRQMSQLVERRGLNTVCDEAACPNKAECWGCGTATFMVLGDLCTRGCRFCAVGTSAHGRQVNPDEPRQLAEAARELNLRYVVVTSVDRDDLPDRGAGHFAACVRELKSLNPEAKVEVLIPDFRGAELDTLAASRPDVIAHNVETVPRLQGVRDARASFDLSLATLRGAKERGFVTKSSLMLGLGETEAEILEAFGRLRAVGCDILVMGQYLQPTPRQLAVERYLSPQEFSDLAAQAKAAGFSSVVSAPLARTSYHALEAFPGQNAQKQE